VCLSCAENIPSAAILAISACFSVGNVTCVMCPLLCTGCHLGDPNGHRVWVDGVSNQELMAVDCEVEDSKLAIALLELLFTKAELSSGCTTKPRRADITKLDTHRLNAIRGEHTCRKKWFEFSELVPAILSLHTQHMSITDFLVLARCSQFQRQTDGRRSDRNISMFVVVSIDQSRSCSHLSDSLDF